MQVETTVILTGSGAILSLIAWSDSDGAAKSALAPYLSLEGLPATLSPPSEPLPTNPIDILEGAKAGYPPGMRYSTEAIFVNHSVSEPPWTPKRAFKDLTLAGAGAAPGHASGG